MCHCPNSSLSPILFLEAMPIGETEFHHLMQTDGRAADLRLSETATNVDRRKSANFSGQDSNAYRNSLGRWVHIVPL